MLVRESKQLYPPVALIGLARTLMGTIDLDPFSSDITNTYVRAKQYFTNMSMALSNTWKGNVYCNLMNVIPKDKALSELIIEWHDLGPQRALLVLPRSYRSVCRIAIVSDCSVYKPIESLVSFVGGYSSEQQELIRLPIDLYYFTRDTQNARFAAQTIEKFNQELNLTSIEPIDKNQD